MIIIIPILIYCILVLGIILLTNKSLKGRARSLRKKIRKRIITISVILFFPLLFFYFSYLFSLALDNHYDVKKGTFLWYATMANNTITFDPAAGVSYSANLTINTGANFKSTFKVIKPDKSEEIWFY